MSTYQKSRPVTRVLVLLEYGDGAQGEVFDVSALVQECAQRGEHKHAKIELNVTTSRDYAASYVSGGNPAPVKTEISWNAMVNFKSSGDSGHLDDAINASLPDSFATADLRKKLQRVLNKVDELEKDIQIQRLRDAASVRAQHPIARMTAPLPLLEVAQ